jgi:hypothetical protein
MHRGIHLYGALLFARDWLENYEEWRSAQPVFTSYKLLEIERPSSLNLSEIVDG